MSITYQPLSSSYRFVKDDIRMIRYYGRAFEGPRFSVGNERSKTHKGLFTFIAILNPHIAAATRFHHHFPHFSLTSSNVLRISTLKSNSCRGVFSLRTKYYITFSKKFNLRSKHLKYVLHVYCVAVALL